MTRVRLVISWALVPVALVLVAACEREAAVNQAPPATSASAGASEERSTSAKARLVALSKNEGSSPIDEQIRAGQQMSQQFPTLRDNWIALGRLWVRKARVAGDPGLYLNARACADIALDIEPDNLPAQNLVAIVLESEQKFRDALDVADRILAKYPNDLMALGTRSDALLEIGRVEDAVDTTQKMVDLKPDLPSYSRAAYLRWLTGDVKGAEAIAWRAIDAGRDPRELEPLAWAIVQAAMMFWNEGDFAGANAGFDKALQAVKEYPPALVGKGRYMLLAANEPAAAVPLFERAYKASPSAEAAWLLGDARQAAGDTEGAAREYAEVVKRGRKDDARTLVQFYATKNRDIDEAVRLAEADLKVRGGPYTDDASAWALYRAGRIKDARIASDRALRFGTKDATLLFHAGAIRIAAGDKAAGLKLVREALTRNPRFDLTGAAEAATLTATK